LIGGAGACVFTLAGVVVELFGLDGAAREANSEVETAGLHFREKWV
jgi:hypothetical protein